MATGFHGLLDFTGLPVGNPSTGSLRVTSAVLEVLCGRLPEPVDVPMPRYTDISEARFGRDLVLADPGGTVQPTATGDWPSLGGLDNLRAAVKRRMITTPGQLVHRPDYGGGLETFVGRLARPEERARLSAGSRQNLLRDPRIADATVGVGAAPGQPTMTLVEVAVKPTGEVEADTVTIIAGS